MISPSFVDKEKYQAKQYNILDGYLTINDGVGDMDCYVRFHNFGPSTHLLLFRELINDLRDQYPDKVRATMPGTIALFDDKGQRRIDQRECVEAAVEVLAKRHAREARNIAKAERVSSNQLRQQ